MTLSIRVQAAARARQRVSARGPILGAVLARVTVAARQPRALNWAGFNIVEVPYTVGASVATTYAIAIAHELGVVPMTDSSGMPIAAAREAAKINSVVVSVS